MANIYGFSVKSLRKFKYHEDITCYSGNLYLNNKKIGTWSQDYMAGPDHFDLIQPYDEQKLDAKIEKLHPAIETEDEKLTGYNLELLMCDLVKLTLDERRFKKALKEGYIGILIVSDGWHELCWKLGTGVANKTKEEILNEMEEEIEAEKKKAGFFHESRGKKHETYLYLTPDDFVIGEDLEIQ